MEVPSGAPSTVTGTGETISKKSVLKSLFSMQNLIHSNCTTTELVFCLCSALKRELKNKQREEERKRKEEEKAKKVYLISTFLICDGLGFQFLIKDGVLFIV